MSSSQTNTLTQRGQRLAKQLGLKSVTPSPRQEMDHLTGTTRRRKRTSSSRSSGGSGCAYSSNYDEELYYYDYHGQKRQKQKERPLAPLCQTIVPLQNKLNLSDLALFDFDNDETCEGQREEDEQQEDGYAGTEEEEEDDPEAFGSQSDYQDMRECPLCDTFSPESDNHVIRAMWNMFWKNFWERGFDYLAKMSHQMWKRDIYDIEVELNGNERRLKFYTWQDFHHHFVSPDCMGNHHLIVIKKLIIDTQRSMKQCMDNTDTVDGLDHRAMDGARKDRKFLLDLYQIDPSTMLGSSTRYPTDAGGLGSFVRNK